MVRTIVSVLVVLVGLGVAGPMGAFGPSPAAAQSDGEGADRLDELVLSSGRVVEGRILEETPTSVRMEVMVGSLTAEATYQKSEIVEIRRDVGAAVEEDAGGAERPSYGGGADEADAGSGDDFDVNDETVRMYYAEIDGRVPFRLSRESMVAIFDDVDDTFEDTVMVRRGDEMVEVVREDRRDKNLVVFKLDIETEPEQAFGGINTANTIAPVLREEIDQKGRRVVFWVDRAVAGGVFIPLTGPEVYFTPDGIMGGIGSLDDFSVGDEMVDEKLIGARLGVAEGYVIRAGFGENGVNVMRAMSRPQFELWVDRSGAGARTLLREPRASDGPNWERVAAPGLPFNMNAELAYDLGISAGSPASLEDLAFELGVDRNYTVIEDNDAEGEIDRWEDDFTTALERVVESWGGELWRELEEIDLTEAENEREWKRMVSQKIRKLREIRSVYRRFEDYLDPTGMRRADVDVRLERWRQTRRTGLNGGGSNRGGGGGAGGGR